MAKLRDKVRKAAQETFSIEPYSPDWPQMFEKEKQHLLSCLPRSIIRRIEHFGSTAVPGLAAKPIIDMLVEVSSLAKTREFVVPILESKGYDYFWRPTWGDDTTPFYAWFIKRDIIGNRTHHIHMVESDFEHWDRLLFRDYLIKYPETASEYEQLKFKLVKENQNNRTGYTRRKGAFIEKITRLAKDCLHAE